jgi:hypothetical protein
MPKPINSIDLAPIRGEALRIFETSRALIIAQPAEILTPALTIVTTIALDNPALWRYNLITLPVFDETRYALLGMLARQLALVPAYVAAVILSTEAWLSVVSKEQYASKERIEPRLDPKRQEVLQVAAMTLDQQNIMYTADLTRQEGRANIGERREIELKPGIGENRILGEFFAAYAQSVYAMRSKSGRMN